MTQHPSCYGKRYEFGDPPCDGGVDKEGDRHDTCAVRDTCRVIYMASTRNLLPATGLVRQPNTAPVATPGTTSVASGAASGWQVPRLSNPPPSTQPQRTNLGNVQAPQGRQAEISQLNNKIDDLTRQLQRAPPSHQPPVQPGYDPEIARLHQQIEQLTALVGQRAGYPMHPQGQQWSSYPSAWQPHMNAQPIQLQAVNYEMPSYLSVQEDPEQGVWAALGWSFLRGVMKSGGHTISHFADHVIFGKKR